jgi:hypothetical protein
MRLDKSDITIWAYYRDGNSRETRARAYIHEAEIPRRQLAGQEESFPVVTLDRFLYLIYSGQIEDPVPFAEQVVMGL